MIFIQVFYTNSFGCLNLIFDRQVVLISRNKWTMRVLFWNSHQRKKGINVITCSNEKSTGFKTLRRISDHALGLKKVMKNNKFKMREWNTLSFKPNYCVMSISNFAYSLWTSKSRKINFHWKLHCENLFRTFRALPKKKYYFWIKWKLILNAEQSLSYSRFVTCSRLSKQ